MKSSTGADGWLLLETSDIFQQSSTAWGETVGIERSGADEIELWISGHKSTWTVEEFYTLAGTMRQVVSGNYSKKGGL
jgi:hypothetical protein